MWICQFLVFYRGMKAITVFIDWAGPGVYVVMFPLMFWMIYKAGWSNISFTLAKLSTPAGRFLADDRRDLAGGSYFSGPMVNFSDFSRFATE